MVAALRALEEFPPRAGRCIPSLPMSMITSENLSSARLPDHRWFARVAAMALGLAAFVAHATPVEFVFEGRGAVSKKWTLKELNPDLPSDWSGYNFLVLEFRASSPQR